jgi:F-type H+-transporting ATPase subunit delta
MDIGTISSRYARALFSLAKEKKEETRIYQDMMMLADSFSLEPALKGALSNPIVTEEEKFRLLVAAGGIEVCDLYAQFIRLVLRHKRENFLLFMAYIYIHLYRKEKKIIRVLFSTAVSVGEEVKDHLQKKLQEETASTVEFFGQVDPELIGGFRLRIGNYRIDASYATQLTDIRARLLENR